MREVATNQECQRADGERMIARDPVPCPCVVGQAAKEGDGRGADGAKFVDVASQCSNLGTGVRGGHVLIKARQRCFNPRANQNARNANSRSASLTWLTTFRMLHRSTAYL